jgi:CheY-like chemotaxis protein
LNTWWPQSQLESSLAWRHIPVIAVTGVGLIHEERNARAAGFADYLLKPVDHTALAAAILRVLTRPKAR